LGLSQTFENYLKGDGSKIAPDDWTWMVDAAFFRIPKKADASLIEKSLSKYVAVQNKARQDWKASGFKLITLHENAVSQDIDNNGLYERPENSAAFGPIVLALPYLSFCVFEFF
jgi:hypothetical protein